MPKQGLYILVLGLFFISPPINGAHAHSGHKEKAVEMEAPAPVESSIYSAEEGDTGAPSGEADMFPLSRADSFSDEIPLLPGAMEPMDHDAAGPMDHKMPEIKIARREWVSPKKKGYGMAVGVTVFAGLIFGALHFKRPNE